MNHEQNFDMRLRRYEIEDEQKWREEIEHIPFIRFPADWEVQVIPPFGDAVVRFRVRLPSGQSKSVYLDSRHSLGYYGHPGETPVSYWEVYPYNDDVGRCARDDVAELLNMIAHETINEGETE